MSSDPFTVLGLPARADVTDDDVRAAWRRIAASAHPDREDGGDPGRYAEAAAAYAALRTSYDRGEALAEPGPGTARRRGTVRNWRSPVMRLLLAAAAGVLAVLAAGWTPGTVAVLAGVLTWVAAGAWRVYRNQRAARQGG